MKRRRFRIPTGSIVLWGVLLLALAAVVWLAVTREPPPPEEEPERRALPVRVQPVVPRAVADTLTLPGRLEARHDARLAAERAGRVVAVRAARGEAVREGDPLVEIFDGVWQAHLARAEVEAREARRDQERLDALRESGGVTERELDAAAARVERAETAVRESSVHVAQCTVRAAFDGVVDVRFVEPGEFVREGDPVVRLVSADPLRLAFSVPERDVQAAEPGRGIPFTLDPLPDETFEAEIDFVSLAGDTRANTFRVEARVANPEGRLRPGMIARVRFTRRVRENAILVPVAAIVPRRGEDVVFLVEDGHAIRRAVVIETLIGTDALLSRGVEEGDLLVVEGHRDLADGVPVRRVDDRDGDRAP